VEAGGGRHGMKYWFLIIMVIGFIGFFLGDRKQDRQPPVSIYITRTDHIRRYDGKEMWVLEYTINGELQNGIFTSQRAMTDYWEYLHTIGTVYQRKEKAGEGSMET
jgi:hypothetical protein